MEEYTDVTTGIRLTVERDGDTFRYTIYWSEDGTFTYEEINEAIRRLQALAGMLPNNQEQS